MSHTRTSYTISGPPHSSLQDESDTSVTDDDTGHSQHHREYDWPEEYDDLDPSDSASASADYQYAGHRAPVRRPSHKHNRSQRQQDLPYRTIPAPQQIMSPDPTEEYDRWGTPVNYNPFYPQHVHGHAAGYNQQQYGGGRGQQMVHYGNFGHPGHASANPFIPVPNAGGAAYYNDPRSTYDMVPYQNNFYGGGPQYSMGVMPPYLYAGAPPPPPTEVPAPSRTPASQEEKKPDPEVERMKQQLELLQAEKKAKEEEIKTQQLQEQIRQSAELEIERRMERARKEAEEQKKELEKAKADAERAARERMENERKAEAEKKAQHEQALARIEAEARAKFETERREEELKKKRDAEMAAAAEAAMKLKLEAAEAAARAKAAAEFKAEIEAKEAAEKKVKDEAEWRKKLEEEAKLKAEIQAREKLEAERIKAEEAKAAEELKKKAEMALREKIAEETKAKIEADTKKSEKPPIKFKDAVGRKFTFPFHVCQTWPGMEELIKQAFMQVETIGPHVQEGHYDLIGPNGEIILPSIWEKVVEPDWSVTMHMWPMDRTPPLRNGVPMDGLRMRVIPPGGIPVGDRHHVHGMPVPMPAGMMPPGATGMPQRPFIPVGGMRPPPPGMHIPANVVNGDNILRHEKKKGGSSRPVGTSSGSKIMGTGFLNFVGGRPAKPSKKRK